MKGEGKGKRGSGKFSDGQKLKSDIKEDIIAEKLNSNQEVNMKGDTFHAETSSRSANQEETEVDPVNDSIELQQFIDPENVSDLLVFGNDDEGSEDGTPLELLEDLEELNIYGDDLDDLEYDYPESGDEF